MSQLKIKDNNDNWIDIPASGIGVPSGGSAGDVLVKSSAVDYATEWQAPQKIKVVTYEATTDSAGYIVNDDLISPDKVILSATFSYNNTFAFPYIRSNGKYAFRIFYNTLSSANSVHGTLTVAYID